MLHACCNFAALKSYHSSIQKIRNDKKRSVTLLRAHNNMLAQMTHGPCSTACSPTAILTCLATLLMSLQLTRPNPPSTFPTHVDWCKYASMSGSLVHRCPPTQTTPRGTPQHA